MRTRMALIVTAALIATGCGGGGSTAGGDGPNIETLRGFVVVVDDQGTSQRFAFNPDAAATSGTAYSADHAVWRINEGEWTAPPVGCLVPGQPVEIGTATVQTAASPGLLGPQVVWITCLPEG